jgi:hypothetical protein
MSRTRGASNAFHQDDGVVLDKEGKPIPTGRPVGVIHMDDGEIVPPPEKPAPASVSPSAALSFVCDRSTWRRDMDGYEALHLLEVMMGAPMTATLTPEQFVQLPADVRRHFRRVRG